MPKRYHFTRDGQLARLPPPGRPGGFHRPHGFKEQFIQEAYEFCLLGYDDVQLAEHFGISHQCFYRWQKEFPAFREAILNGKARADAKVARSLYERATGYTFASEKIVVVDGGVQRVAILEHCPPDVRAAGKWLGNRQRGTWTEKPQDPDPPKQELVGIQINITQAEAANVYRKMIEG